MSDINMKISSVNKKTDFELSGPHSKKKKRNEEPKKGKTKKRSQTAGKKETKIKKRGSSEKRRINKGKFVDLRSSPCSLWNSIIYLSLNADSLPLAP